MIRIVKMHFREEKADEFLAFFHTIYPKISTFPGCTGLELLRDENNPAIFFTYSHWVDASALEAYRNSELFKDTWARTKAMFAQKGEAWSVAPVKVTNHD